MAYRSVPKTQFLLIACLLSSSLAFAASASTSVGPAGARAAKPGAAAVALIRVSQTVAGTTAGGTGSNPGVSGVISGGYYLQPYSAALQSSFGTPPYTYTLVGGALPPGITMNSAGKV